MRDAGVSNNDVIPYFPSRGTNAADTVGWVTSSNADFLRISRCRRLFFLGKVSARNLGGGAFKGGRGLYVVAEQVRNGIAEPG